MPCEKCKCQECTKGRKEATANALKEIRADIEALWTSGRGRFKNAEDRLMIAEVSIKNISRRLDALEQAEERKRTRWWNR